MNRRHFMFLTIVFIVSSCIKATTKLNVKKLGTSTSANKNNAVAGIAIAGVAVAGNN